MSRHSSTTQSDQAHSTVPLQAPATAPRERPASAAERFRPQFRPTPQAYIPPYWGVPQTFQQLRNIAFEVRARERELGVRSQVHGGYNDPLYYPPDRRQTENHTNTRREGGHIYTFEQGPAFRPGET